MNNIYTQQTLREAIYYMVPTFKKIEEEEVFSLNLPNMLSSAIAIAFMQEPYKKDSAEFQNHANILRNALIDLKIHGQFMFKESNNVK